MDKLQELERRIKRLEEEKKRKWEFKKYDPIFIEEKKP